MNAASQVPSGVLISTSVSTIFGAPEAAPAAARPAATDITKSRRGRLLDDSLSLCCFVSSAICFLLRQTVYLFRRHSADDPGGYCFLYVTSDGSRRPPETVSFSSPPEIVPLYS